jgi:hypothetical protein
LLHAAFNVRHWPMFRHAPCSRHLERKRNHSRMRRVTAMPPDSGQAMLATRSRP